MFNQDGSMSIAVLISSSTVEIHCNLRLLLLLLIHFSGSDCGLLGCVIRRPVSVALAG
jgi:hypothetical protein